MQAKYFWMCLQAAVQKIPQNLIMCFSTLLICLVIGLFIALARIYRVPVLAPVLDVLLALTKAFPANLILLICVMAYTYTFNDIIALLHLDITIRDVNLIYIAIIALIIVALPGLSEVMRSGLLAIPKGQFEAGYAVGMTAFQTFRDIILPQLFRVTVPMLTNSTLSLMKTTALVNVMGVSDILKGATDAATDSYCFLEAYVAAALIFWCLGALIEKAGRTLEAYLNRSHKRTTA